MEPSARLLRLEPEVLCLHRKQQRAKYVYDVNLSRPSKPRSGGAMTATIGEGAHRPLSREAILDVALQLVDQAGLDALSMRRLGARLGVEGMALYRHVANKAALLDGLVERLYLLLDAQADESADWTTILVEVASAYRRLAIAHPKAFPLLTTRPPATTAALVRAEPVFAALARAGFGPAERIVAAQTFFTFLNGYLLAEVGVVPGHGDEPEPDSLGAYRAVDASLAPYVREFGTARDASLSLESEFKTSVAIIVEGCRRLLDGTITRVR
jgi:TetR/AcrR family transcriptional regulator, tetracycline repressor protein